MTDNTEAQLPDGLRIYAIGDIHGRLDLLKILHQKIIDDSRSSSRVIKVIFLGDYIDRGIHSREVIDYLIEWKKDQHLTPHYLLGNHELVMRSILNHSDNHLLEDWMQFGGRETLMSYGVKPSSLLGKPSALIKELTEKTPQSHRQFLDELSTSVSFGDYFFCHAGVDPAISLDKQTEESLAWIRHKFLTHQEPYAKMIVHGHSISLEAEFRSNRIGIDTGAYATGKLTALGLEDRKQWILQTE